MQQVVARYIQEHSLITPSQRVLVGVSGGLDSVVLVHVLLKLGYAVAIAHVNFKLRGLESDEDTVFVEQLAKTYSLPFYHVTFDTKAYMQQEGVSLEMAARTLRYQWFEEIRQREEYDVIAVAHHLNDQIETVFINLLRGTGIAGIRGMLPKNGAVVRPFLEMEKNTIEAYATKHQLVYRIDSSNASTDIIRNKIRHEIMPLFLSINPSFGKVMGQNIAHFSAAEQFVLSQLSSYRFDEQAPYPRVIPFLQFPIAQRVFIVYELVKSYGFLASQVADLLHAHTQTGAVVYSASYRLLKDRDTLCLALMQPKSDASYFISSSSYVMETPLALTFSDMPIEEPILQEKQMAFLDAQKLHFPLVLRRWTSGDYFYPIGMKGKKKISDFLIDKKYSLLEKESIWLLCSGNDIVWVVGERIDDRYKVTSKTTLIQRVILKR